MLKETRNQLHVSRLTSLANQYRIIAAGLLLSLSAQTLVEAQDRRLPQDCWQNGYVDLSTCSVPDEEIAKELLVDGYYGAFGTFISGIPSDELHKFNPGTYLWGSMTYMTRSVMPAIFAEKVEIWNLDPNLFVGGIATDSCEYVGGSAWVRRRGTTDAWVGPLLIADCAQDIHKCERAREVGTIGELGYEIFEQFQDRGRLDNMEMILKPLTDLTPPPLTIQELPINYSEAWLQEARAVCPT